MGGYGGCQLSTCTSLRDAYAVLHIRTHAHALCVLRIGRRSAAAWWPCSTRDASPRTSELSITCTSTVLTCTVQVPACTKRWYSTGVLVKQVQTGVYSDVTQYNFGVDNIISVKLSKMFQSIFQSLRRTTGYLMTLSHSITTTTTMYVLYHNVLLTLPPVVSGHQRW